MYYYFLLFFTYRDAGGLYAIPQLPVTQTAYDKLLPRQQAQKEARLFITNFTREGIHVYRYVVQ